MEAKKWYQSRTEWLNILTAIGILVTLVTGVAFEDGEIPAIAAGIVAVVNIFLRFRTNQPVSK